MNNNINDSANDINNTMNNIPDEQLYNITAQHLYYLENINTQRHDLHINNIPIIPVFTYELIQILNHAYLNSLLKNKVPDGA